MAASPTSVTAMRSRPRPLMAPPTTASPGCFWTGRLSPVSRLSSTWLWPLSTRPSAGRRSPGRTTTTSPAATAAAGSSISAPSRSTRAVSGRSAASARMAAPAERFARPSSHFPSSTRVMTTAEASNQVCPCAPVATRNKLSKYAADVPRATSRSMFPVPARSACQAAR